jgi:hypothetical protein
MYYRNLKFRDERTLIVIKSHTIVPSLVAELQIPPGNGHHVFPIHFVNVGYRVVIVQAQDQLARDRVPFDVVQYYREAQTHRERHANSQGLVIVRVKKVILPVPTLLFVVLLGPPFPYHPSC